jgi:Pyruvate/2-oxoacid:ferredoxin oxidoreductase delta subunit
LGWNYCPEEEGIKTYPAGMASMIAVGTTALKKKGLRLDEANSCTCSLSWNYCPEEEGIKTHPIGTD